MSDARRPEFPDLRGPVTLALLGVLLPALMFAGLFAGAIPLEIETVVNSLLGRDGPRQDFIVLQSRLPRALLAALAGGALALSGALIQALMRNPLASPKIVGINSGAAFAVPAIDQHLAVVIGRLRRIAQPVGGVAVHTGLARHDPLTTLCCRVEYRVDAGGGDGGERADSGRAVGQRQIQIAPGDVAGIGGV